jgi:mannose-1-phosphate guanylyltransferase
MKDNPNAIITVTPADHVIENEEEFRKTINEGFDFVSRYDALITLGIKPDKPETGYGYIQAELGNHIKGYDKLLKVKAFTEKPDLKTAKLFIESNEYYWNSGIFIWSAKSILKAIRKFLPDIFSTFNEGNSLLGTTEEDKFIKKAYSTCQSISIDYGVLEKADNVYVLEANMDWSDLGTWSSLSGHSQSDASENAIVRGKAYTHECRGNLISLTPGKVAILQGLKDYIVVETSEALLIIKKDDEQNIKLYLDEISSHDTF